MKQKLFDFAWHLGAILLMILAIIDGFAGNYARAAYLFCGVLFYMQVNIFLKMSEGKTIDIKLDSADLIAVVDFIINSYLEAKNKHNGKTTKTNPSIHNQTKRGNVQKTQKKNRSVPEAGNGDSRGSAKGKKS